MKTYKLVVLLLFLSTQCLHAQEHLADIRSQIKWINVEALQSCMADFGRQSAYDQQALTPDLQYISQHLASVKKRLDGPDSLVAIKEAKALIAKQRRILLSNPLFDMDKVVVTRFKFGKKARRVMAASMCMPPSNYMGLMDVPHMGYNAEIIELSALRKEQQTERTIFKPQDSSGIADVQLHWDANRLLFSTATPVKMASGITLPSWHVFEVGLDGKLLKQITPIDDPDLEFADPCYLPSGKILVSTNIGYNGIPCENGLRTILNLAIYNPSEKSLRKISFDQDGNWSPTVLSNGRVMYTRWEYADLTHYFSRIVMHSNPDGTEAKALYGSNSYWPNSTYDMKQLPNSGIQFIGVVTGHHGISRSGRLYIFDPAKGRKEEKGVVQEIPYKNKKVIPEIKDYLVDGVWPQFTKPYPINEKYFLVSAKLHKDGLWGVYLVDIFDNLTLITEKEGEGYIAAIPVVKKQIPPVIPDRVNLNDKEITVFIQDIYEGEGLKAVPRGTIKQLRVFTYEYAYLNSPSDFDAQGIQSGWDIKRELGTVAVETDGSVIFKAPANTPISIQPLDEKGRATQWMRSWFTGMPGEIVSCVGCHEDQNKMPIPKRVMASHKKPLPLTPPDGGVRPFTFETEVQPILNKYCVSCHNGTNGRMTLMGNETELYKRGVVTKIERQYLKSYLNLHPYVYRQGPEADIYVLHPYEYHASNSELIQMLEKNHHNVKINELDMNTLCKWIDFNAPYSGSFEIRAPFKGYPQYERRKELMKRYADIDVGWKEELENYAKQLKQKSLEQIIPTKEAFVKDTKTDRWCFTEAVAKEKQKKANVTIEKQIEIAPGVVMHFMWIPSGKFEKGRDQGQKYPINHKTVQINKGFWMGKLEVSNQQYLSVYPDHDSRFIGQQWKDHTTPGYSVNLPEQPVVRVAWTDVMEYCRKLSAKTGLNITLPTEEQWEWACRAGSGNDMWYGERTIDYSTFENMADQQIAQLAVMGVDPKPMPKDYFLRKFWDFVPRDIFADDGSLVSVNGGKYKANPWGLHDMHGNVAEWTSSSFMNEKMVCGGSWRDRAEKSTAFYRRYFKPWQAPYNVGFRLIIMP